MVVSVPPSSPLGQRRAGGFSLVELMLVVAILGVLATLAIPAYNVSVLKARRSEAWTVLNGVGLADVTYYSTRDAWIDCTGSPNPGLPLTKELRAWDRTIPCWTELGYEPDGDVRCNYYLGVFGTGDSWARGDAYCDVDDDNSSFILRDYLQSTVAAESYHGFRAVNLAKY